MDGYMKIPEVLKFLGISRTTLWRWEKLKDFPKAKKGPGGKRWKKTAIEAYYDGRYRPSKKAENPA